jgi:hypothetical protein
MNIPPGFAQANLLFTGVAAPRGAQIALGVALEGGASNPVAVGQDVYNAFQGTVLPELDNDLILSGCKVKIGPNTNGPDGTYLETSIGGVNSFSVTPQVALLITKITALGGRTNKGRMFVPGIVENWADGAGVVSPSTQATMDAALLVFLADIAGSNTLTGLVILHNAVELAPTPVTALKTMGLVATQRRRLRKVGGRRNTGGPSI